tara:strand:+ start:216 stop:1403 length:1188 start_codon:yes stop_codon:yes gene_type:complete
MIKKMINKINKNIINKLFFIKNGLLEVTFSDKEKIFIGDKESNLTAYLNIHSFNAFNRIIKSGSIGFSEAYINSELSSPDISKVIFLFSLNRNHNKNIIYGKRIYSLWNYLKHAIKPNTKSGSKKNISYHYDLGNKFYSKWLDNSMTYSSALFDNKELNLTNAQNNKYSNICKIINLKEGDDILEIGCGWGGFAEYAAKKYKSKITSITLSSKQTEYAKQRIQKEGLSDLINIQICDYREINKKYDKIISIEMFEAVGKKYWPVFFQKLNQNIKDDGLIGMQLISIKDDLYSKYKNNADFIQKYIFPGGFLPSIDSLQKMTSKYGLKMSVEKTFGKDYANTLSIWRNNFLSNWDEISKEKKFDIKFKNMWEYYLAYCEAGFLSNSINVHQIILNK